MAEKPTCSCGTTDEQTVNQLILTCARGADEIRKTMTVGKQ